MSGQDESERRLREVFSQPDGEVASAAGCPDDGQIWSASRGELPAEQTGAMLDHSLHCPRCRESWRLASALAGEAALDRAGDSATGGGPQPVTAPAPGDAQGRGAISFSARHHRLMTAAMALAASLVLLFLLPTLLNRQEAPPPASLLSQQFTASLHLVGRETPLGAGDRLRTGDRLYLTLESDVPVHVYVINRGEGDAPSVLFPVGGAQWENPVPPGARRRLPGDSGWAYDSWEVSSSTGAETFTIVATLEPLPEMESALGLLAPAAAEGQIVRGAPVPPPGPPVSRDDLAAAWDRALAAVRSREAAGTAVLHQVVLENPPPPGT